MKGSSAGEGRQCVKEDQNGVYITEVIGQDDVVRRRRVDEWGVGSGSQLLSEDQITTITAAEVEIV